MARVDSTPPQTSPADASKRREMSTEEEILGFVVSCLAPLETFMSGDDGTTQARSGTKGVGSLWRVLIPEGTEGHSLEDLENLEPMGFGPASLAVNIGLLVRDRSRRATERYNILIDMPTDNSVPIGSKFPKFQMCISGRTAAIPTSGNRVDAA